MIATLFQMCLASCNKLLNSKTELSVRHGSWMKSNIRSGMLSLKLNILDIVGPHLYY